MVNYARRQCIEFKITYPVRAYEHSTLLGIEAIHHTLQGILVAVDIVTVKLHRKTSATRIVHGKLPTTADTKIVARRDYMHHPFVGIRVDDCRCPVYRMVIHHQHIERERSLLLEYRSYGIGNGRFTVEYRNDYRSFYWEITGRKVYFLILACRQQATDSLEVMGTHLFHLNLHVALRRVHIIELFLTALACIVLTLGIYILAMMVYASHAAHGKPQLVKSGIFTWCKRLCKILLESRCPEQQHRSEIEIIAQGTRLILYRRSLNNHSVNTLAVV